MSIYSAQRKVRDARVALEQAEVALQANCYLWKRNFEKHRSAVILGGGFLAGIAFTALPPRIWAKLGAAIGGGTAWLARSPFSATLAGTLFGLVRARFWPSSEGTPPPASAENEKPYG